VRYAADDNVVCVFTTSGVQGVTHVSQMTQYPADVSTDTPALWVAHFAHPIEVEWVARTAPTPKDWPRLLLQVSCTSIVFGRTAAAAVITAITHLVCCALR
jgi:hypothetical protein